MYGSGIYWCGKSRFFLGRYFSGHSIKVSGYYSRNPKSAREAADFTGTGFYTSIDDLMRDSKVIFITTPDDAIGQIWEQLKAANICDRIVCHCSGVLSSEIFSDISAPRYRCRGYSIHPLLAVSSRLDSYKELSNTLFTIESSANDGAARHSETQTDEIDAIFCACGNQVIHLRPQDKARYHAAGDGEQSRARACPDGSGGTAKLWFFKEGCAGGARAVYAEERGTSRKPYAGGSPDRSG